MGRRGEAHVASAFPAVLRPLLPGAASSSGLGSAGNVRLVRAQRVAAGTDTHADCQLITLQNEGSAGERWSMGAGLAPPRYGIHTFGEKRARKGSGNVGEPEQPVLTRAAHRSRSLLAGRALCLKAEDPSKLKRLCVDPSPAPATINSAVCPAGAEFNKLRSEIL